jgi:sulfur-oxidizing protein SoxY
MWWLFWRLCVNKRRQLIAVGGAALLTLVVRDSLAAAPDFVASAAELAAAIASFTGGKTVRVGKVKLDVPTLVDNGNSVTLTVSADSPMTAGDYVQTLAVFNERNPQRDVARFSFSPASGKASAATRIRLATSQKLVAVAQMSDGSFWSQSVDVLVTLAACIEGDG